MTDENDPEFQRMLAAMQGGGYPDAVTSSETADFQPTYSPGALPTVDSIKQGLLSQQLQMPGTYDPAPTDSTPPPSGVPNNDDVMRQLAKQTLMSGLTAPSGDVAGLAQAQQQGNVGSLISGLGSSISGMVGTPYGGAMNPAAYLGALATHRQQNFQEGTYGQQNAQNLPVQQYMQRQAQGQIGVQQRKQAAEDAIRYFREEAQEKNYQSEAAHRLAQDQAKAGAGTFTPEQKKAAQDDYESQAKLLGVDLPEGVLESITPANIKDNKKALAQHGAALARAQENEKRAAAHLKEVYARGGNAREKSAASQALANTRVEIAKYSAGLRGFTTDVRAGGGVIPGVTGDTYASPGAARDFAQILNSSTSLLRTGNEILKEYNEGGASGWALLSPTERKARITTMLEAMQPLANAAEFKQAATQAHLGNVANQMGNPTAIENLANDQYFPAKLKTMMSLISKSLKTRAAATVSGGVLNQEPGEDIKPGRVRSAPAGRPGSANPTAPVMPPMPGSSAAPAGYAYSPDGKQRQPVDANGKTIGPIEANPGG